METFETYILFPSVTFAIGSDLAFRYIDMEQSFLKFVAKRHECRFYVVSNTVIQWVNIAYKEVQHLDNGLTVICIILFGIVQFRLPKRFL